MFSVALSVGSHRPGVTWRPALRSPDFPLPGWDGANQRRPLGLTAIARLTPAITLPQKPGFAPIGLRGVAAGWAESWFETLPRWTGALRVALRWTIIR